MDNQKIANVSNDDCSSIKNRFYNIIYNLDQNTKSEQNRLDKKVKELEAQNKNTDYIIKGKLQEKDEQIKSLTDQFSSMRDMLNKMVKGISETKDQKHVNSVTQSLFSSGVIKEIEY